MQKAQELETKAESLKQRVENPDFNPFNSKNYEEFKKENTNLNRLLKQRDIYDSLLWESISSRFPEGAGHGVRKGFKIVALPEKTHPMEHIIGVVGIGMM